MPSSLADEDLAHEIQALKIMQANLLDLAEQFCAMFIMQQAWKLKVHFKISCLAK